MLWLLIALVNVVLVCLAVLIHAETLYHLAKWLPRAPGAPRYRVLLGVFGILVAHVVEIWMFALAYYALLHVDGMGELVGPTQGRDLMDCSYFSFITFTTVGYGDLVASGMLRYLTGLEALTGFVLITWSASFLFLEMQKYWPNLDRHRR